MRSLAAKEFVPAPTLPVVSRAVAAEAAVWVARLHGPDRSSEMERDCLAWQARSAEHRLAFERCTDVWQEVPRVTLGDAYAASPGTQAPAGTGPAPALGRNTRRRRWAAALAMAAVVALGTAALQRWPGRGLYSTGVGEQQVLLLDDGTRMSLNTATRVRVDLGARQRHVEVLAGEALFEVARDARRPFVVQAAGSEVVALGTVFGVRLTPQRRGGDAVAVTLVEGHVAVRAGQGRDGGVGAGAAAARRSILLEAGERARIAVPASGGGPAPPPQVDRPPIEQLLAWQRGEVVFDDVSLADAVAEMNRYSRTPLVLDVPASAGWRVSGQFRAGDSLGFAKAVAALHGLRVEPRRGGWALEPA